MDGKSDTYQAINLLYRKVQEFHLNESFGDVPDVQHPHLVPVLKPYQSKAVQWMLTRELNKVVIDNPLPGSSSSPEKIELPSGGILADEMGLGKTVEVLACILLNPRNLPNDSLNSSEKISKTDIGEEISNSISLQKPQKVSFSQRSTEDVFSDSSSAKKSRLSQVSLKKEILNSSSLRKSNRSSPCSLSDENKTEDKIPEMIEDVGDCSVSRIASEPSHSESFALTAEVEEKLNGGPTEVNSSIDACIKDEPNGSQIAGMVKETGEPLNFPIKDEPNGDQVSKLIGEISDFSPLCASIKKEPDRSPKSEMMEAFTDSFIHTCKEEELSGGEGGEVLNVTGGHFPKSITIGKQLQKTTTVTKYHLNNVIPEEARVDNLKQIDADDDEKKKNDLESICHQINFELPDDLPLDEVMETFSYSLEEANWKDKKDLPVQPRSNVSIQKLEASKVAQSSSKRRSRKRKSENVEIPSTNTTPAGSGKRKATKPMSATKKALNEWYEALLAEVTPKQRKVEIAEQTLHCFCDEASESDKIQCIDCKCYQHRQCVDFLPPLKRKNYVCPACFLKKDPVPAKTTFIVSPSSISDQWIEEIEKHTNPRLKCLKYEGVRVNGYIQPTTIAQYDILLTSYETLAKELNYTPDDVERASRSLRHAKRYFAPQSPLPCVQWWRICLDEAQMVEGISNRPATMTRKLAAIHRWAVTGTPIQKTVDDLIGLMEFLKLEKFALVKQWKLLKSIDSHEFYQFLSRIMWRHSKSEVIEQFGVPTQTIECQTLKFTAIESHFYQRQHTECSNEFLKKIARYPSLDIPLASIDRKEVSRILAPLLALRQACSHPQAVRGKVLSKQNKIMTMEELLALMVNKTRVESEEFLRVCISALNGIAGLHIITGRTDDAIACYREVLHLCQNYEGSLTADTLQKIHTLYNLAEVLELNTKTVPVTLRDSTAKQDAEKLEKEYLDKKKAVMVSTQQQMSRFAAKISAISQDSVLGFSRWWMESIDWAPSSKDLLSHLKNTLADCNYGSSFISLVSKLTSKHRLTAELAVWLADADNLRVSIIDKLKLMETTPTNDLVEQALRCHLRHKKKSKEKSCVLCEVEQDLRSYESCLFMVSNKEEKMPDVNEESEEENDYEDEAGEASSSKATNKPQTLKPVTLFESSWKGSWKNSQHLKILVELYNYIRNKGAAGTICEDAKKHLKLMNVVKQEFKTLRLLWTQISELVQSCDEVVMAKTRLRLRLASDTPVKKAANKMDHIHIIDSHQIDYEYCRLRNEHIAASASLKKKTGVLLYLKNLQKEKTEEKVNICPICRNEMKDKWAVLVCGHCICYECIPSLLSMSSSTENVECAVCREKNAVADIFYVDCHQIPDDGALKGSYSTKIAAVIRHIQKLRSENIHVKVLVFSAWEKVLDILEEGFQQNDIDVVRLKPGPKYKNSVKKFKIHKEINVLLLQYKSGAKGLNLIEATHVILVEPVLNPSDELQAIGRVHRMGQTKPTFVHRFIVENTIEEKMLSAIQVSDVSQWQKNKVTLQQLTELFRYSPSKKNEVNGGEVLDF